MMKVAWISLNLIGFGIIAGGAIYAVHHKLGVPVVLIGMMCLGVSNMIKLRVFSKNRGR
jgi:hypothetical protein